MFRQKDFEISAKAALFGDFSSLWKRAFAC
jgi:hypothetical protein